jgi:hypothetical protein
MNPLIISAGVGMLSGAHAAIWGMYKDSVHEGFSSARFARSIIIGTVCAAIIQIVLQLPMPSGASIVLLFGLAYAAERGIVEVWKTFFRDEDQSKYFIPMQFSIRGEPVRSRALRFAAGIGYLIVVGSCLVAIARLDRSAAATATSAALVGLGTGLIIAIGGGWKDAPKEGFSALKFMRSPAMTVAYAVLLSRVTESHLLLAAASIGFERATAETYKTFFFPSKPRGKFTGKPITNPEMFARRRWFVPVYVAIWCVVLASGIASLTQLGA